MSRRSVSDVTLKNEPALDALALLLGDQVSNGLAGRIGLAAMWKKSKCGFGEAMCKKSKLLDAIAAWHSEHTDVADLALLAVDDSDVKSVKADETSQGDAYTTEMEYVSSSVWLMRTRKVPSCKRKQNDEHTE
jgi:hypothetical protein